MDELDLTEKTPRTLDEEEIRVDAPPRASTPVRAARGTRSNTAIPPPLPAMRLAAAPPSKLIPFLPPPEPQSPVPGSFPVVRAPSDDVPTTLPRGSVAPRVTRASAQMSVPRAPEPDAVRRSDVVPVPPDDVEIDVAPFAADEPHAAPDDEPDDEPDTEDDEPIEAAPAELTHDLVRPARPPRHALTIAGIAVCATLIGVTVGLVIRSARGPRSTPPVPPALATAPADPPAPLAPPPPRPPAVEVAATTSAAAVAPAAEPSDDEPARADLAITSQPDGATVTLIANGDATVVGKTPITASVDPALTYDVVFALRDHPTTILHLDAGKVHELAVDLTPQPMPAPPRRRTGPAPSKALKPVSPKPAPRTR